MSRALDPETAASLKRGDPLAAYQSISSVLALPDDGLLEIEFLGKGHILGEGQFVVQDGRAVGISKLGLVQAFMVARQRLRDHLDGSRMLAGDEVFAATAVILLFDPEYLTAANSRKRLIQAEISNGGDVKPRLEREQRLVDSLLTSRLHRHTKSPTLWSHRRWLMTTLTSLDLPVNVLGGIKDVVSVAGERHARNYYAWCHARFLMGLDVSLDRPGILAAVQAWCFQHHTDISGWSFLYFLLSTESDASTEPGRLVFAEVLNLVNSLRLANESVWVFLRTAAASGLVGDGQYAQFLKVQAAVLETSKTPADQAVLRAATDWCETYRRRSGNHLAGV
jgi:protein prenyltransferase alpha subunit repeat containing protein 1